MKIHTDTLTKAHLIRAAADLHRVRADAIERGSRRRARAFDVTLSAMPRPGRRTRNSGNQGAAPESAATWDEWGMFIDTLFRIDEHAVIGPYGGYADFRYQTGGRYDTRDFMPCDQHKWESHTTHEFICAKGCDAMRRTPQRESATTSP